VRRRTLTAEARYELGWVERAAMAAVSANRN
jgi:hypothetical protein